VRRQNKGIPRAIEQIKKPGFPDKSLVTHIFSWKETDRAFELSSEYRGGVIKAVIRM